jgi:hypothetical protein
MAEAKKTMKKRPATIDVPAQIPAEAPIAPLVGPSTEAIAAEPEPEAAIPAAASAEPSTGPEQPLADPGDDRQRDGTIDPAPPEPHRTGTPYLSLLLGGGAGAIFGVAAAILYPILLPPAADTAERTRAAALEQRIAALETRPDRTGQIQAIATSLADLQRKLGAPGQPADTTEISARLKSIEESIAGLKDRQSRQSGATLLSAAGILHSVFDRGAPFAAEFAAIEAILSKEGGPLPDMTALRNLAPGGAATSAQLADRLKALTPALLSADAPAATGSLFDRLERSAATLVKIRPSGTGTGLDTASALSRMEAASRRDQLDTALTILAGLPEPVRRAATAWEVEARSRDAAALAIRSLESRALQLVRSSLN